MIDLFEFMGFEQYLAYNAKLQQKKNLLRKKLKGMGVLTRSGDNTFDHYKYFSEAQYKQLFTGLFSECGLELTATEVDRDFTAGTEKQPNGRIEKICFRLSDTETGFFEESEITGEGLDKGDKAAYKAYTGAVKYYLACNFLVATGDDPEQESPEAEPMATEKQIAYIKKLIPEDKHEALAAHYKVKDLTGLTASQASEIISRKKGDKHGKSDGSSVS